MFWRFGFANASSLDSLLSNPSVSIESILDEDDLLQECKSQNTRLIDYFSRPDILKRLFGYVTRTVDCEDHGVFKYPYVATEVLCSEIWSIVETSLSSPNEILLPFWETVLDRTIEDMKTEMVLASHFAKINMCFLNKKPDDTFTFIQSIPGVLDKLLIHIESPSIVDLLLRLIQLDDSNWLSSEHLIPKLLNLLSPQHPVDVHTVISDLLKTIISMASPSPSSSQNETGLPPSNIFVRQLSTRGSIEVFLAYILWDFGPNHNVSTSEDDGLPALENCTSSVTSSISLLIELIRKNNSDFFEPYLFHFLRQHLLPIIGDNESERRDKMEQTLHNLTERVGLVNLGPLLELTTECLTQLKNYLIVPRSLTGPIRTTTGPLTPLTFERYRIVELFAELLHCSNMSLLNRSAEYDTLYDEGGHLRGGLEGLERLGIAVEMGNAMGNNRLSSVGSESRYGDEDDDRDMDNMDETGGGGEDDDDEDDDDDSEGMVDHSAGFPVSKRRPPQDEDDEDMSSDEDEAMEEMVMNEDLESSSPSLSSDPGDSAPSSSTTSPLTDRLSPLPDRSIDSLHSPRVGGLKKRSSRLSNPLGASTSSLFLSQIDLASMTKDLPWRMPLGEKLKEKFLEIGILDVLLDLFFAHPWNNFLHVSVYDVIHQILTGPVEIRGGDTSGPASSSTSNIPNGSNTTQLGESAISHSGNLNRSLTISLFRDVKLMKRIVEGHRLNEEAVAKPKSSRLGYMGHLSMISADVLVVLERFPSELKDIIVGGMSDDEKTEWEEYVKVWKEVTRRDERLLGGGKPVLSSTMASGGASKWRVDEAELHLPPSPTAAVLRSFGERKNQGDEDDGKLALAPPNEMKGAFHRSTDGKRRREGSADFGVAEVIREEEEEEEEETSAFDERRDKRDVSQFARYLASELGSSQLVTSSLDEDDSDDDDDGGTGWLSQASNLAPSEPRRPLGGGFGDVFSPSVPSAGPSSSSTPASRNPFSDDDDEFGAFTSSGSPASSSALTDPFGIASTSPASSSSTFSPDDMILSDDGSFDFGDFQTAEGNSSEEEEEKDGQLTPTAGSWSFEDDFGVGAKNSGGVKAGTEKAGG